MGPLRNRCESGRKTRVVIGGEVLRAVVAAVVAAEAAVKRPYISKHNTQGQSVIAPRVSYENMNFSNRSFKLR